MEKKKREVKVIQNAEDEIPFKILAQDIRKLSDSFVKMEQSGLTTRAMILLIHDASGVGKPAIKAALEGMERLKYLYLRKTT